MGNNIYGNTIENCERAAFSVMSAGQGAICENAISGVNAVVRGSFPDDEPPFSSEDAEDVCPSYPGNIDVTSGAKGNDGAGGEVFSDSDDEIVWTDDDSVSKDSSGDILMPNDDKDDDDQDGGDILMPDNDEDDDDQDMLEYESLGCFAVTGSLRVMAAVLNDGDLSTEV